MIINAVHRWAFIEIPRTGTKSMRDALMKIPGTFFYGNHNEVTTLPKAFKGFKMAVMVRDPVRRLHSLYCYLRMKEVVNRHPEWFGPLHAEVMEMTFSDWLVNGKALFCGGAWPYVVGNPVPEQDKSQVSYFESADHHVEVFSYESMYLNEKDDMRLKFSNSFLNGLPLQLRRLNASRPDGNAANPYLLLNKAAAEKIRCLELCLYDKVYLEEGDHLRAIIKAG